MWLLNKKKDNREDKCVICDKDNLPTRELTCSKECARLYSRIMERVTRFLSRNRKCLICRHEIIGNNKKVVCSDDCEKLYDKLLERLTKKDDNNNPNKN